MAKCGCGAQTCACRLTAGENITIEGSGTARDPWVISAAGGEGGSSGWSAGDRKETYRADTPAGWLVENGQAVSRTTYAALFAAIGTRFGAGDGSTTFNLPSAGRFTVSAGAGYPQDQTGGNASTTLTQGMLPSHAHGMSHTHDMGHDHAGFLTDTGEGTHSHGSGLKIRTKNIGGAEAGNQGDTVARGPSSGAVSNAPLEWEDGSGAHRHLIDVPAFVGITGVASASTTGSIGGGQAFTNLPPYRAVRALIKT